MGRVEIIEAVKVYSDAPVVDRVSLAVKDQEFLVLLGPSGCGKSTLLRLIAGLEDLTEGEIYIDGRLMNYEPPVKRDVAMVFQNYALYPHLTVEENLSFPLRRAKVPKDETRTRVLEVARLLDLSEHLGRRPGQLSGGQRQRVALGRAIIRRPKVFLMDEPLSNLDALLRVQMRDELLRLHKQVGRTTIYVTHDQVEAMTMGDRIVVMRRGVVHQVGSPQDVYDHPVDTFVATFVGSPAMNLFEGCVEEVDGRLDFVAAAVRVALPPALADAARRSGDLRDGATLGIRSEHVEVSGAAAREGLAARVAFLEPVGADVFVSLMVGDHRCIARTGRDRTPEPDSAVTVSFPGHALHLFDRTGRHVLAGEAAGGDGDSGAVAGADGAGIGARG
jgi:multiple sugar transport system ATP-binding protein